MRDINRIDDILQALGECWKKYPDLRFMQLISCLSFNKDSFYVEDDEFLEVLNNFLRR